MMPSPFTCELLYKYVSTSLGESPGSATVWLCSEFSFPTENINMLFYKWLHDLIFPFTKQDGSRFPTFHQHHLAVSQLLLLQGPCSGILLGTLLLKFDF